MAKPVEVGDHYGRLVVVKQSGSDKYGRPTWLCRCDCGKEKIALDVNLRYGGTRSCNGHRAIDMVGQKVGRLTVVSRSDPKGTQAMWFCECICGGKTTVPGAELRRKATQSCGCLQRDRTREFLNERNPSRPKDVVLYAAAHQRVYAQRGPASQYGCRHCDEQAQDWAYDHTDPDEIISFTKGSVGMSYSLKPNFFIPLCKKCHRAFDGLPNLR